MCLGGEGGGAGEGGGEGGAGEGGGEGGEGGAGEGGGDGDGESDGDGEGGGGEREGVPRQYDYDRKEYDRNHAKDGRGVVSFGHLGGLCTNDVNGVVGTQDALGGLRRFRDRKEPAGFSRSHSLNRHHHSGVLCGLLPQTEVCECFIADGKTLDDLGILLDLYRAITEDDSVTRKSGTAHEEQRQKSDDDTHGILLGFVNL